MRFINFIEATTDSVPFGMMNLPVEIDDDGGVVQMNVTYNGMDAAELNYQDGEIIWIHVEPFFRKQGLGREMVELLKSKGYPVVMPDARTDDGKAFFGKMDQEGRLQEIKRVGDYEDVASMDGIDISTAQNLGEIGAGLRLFREAEQFYFVDQEDMVVGDVTISQGHPGFRQYFRPFSYASVDHIWIDPKYRGKGVGYAFYKYMLDTIGWVVVSDGYQSDHAESLWYKLLQEYEARVIDDNVVGDVITSWEQFDAVYDDDDEHTLIAMLPTKRMRPLGESTHHGEYSQQFYNTIEQLYAKGKPVEDISSASADADFVLEPEDYDLEWRWTMVPLNIFPELDFSHEEDDNREQRFQSIRNNPKAALGEPILIGLDYDRGVTLPLFDGHHRIQIARELGVPRLPAFVGMNPQSPVTENDSFDWTKPTTLYRGTERPAQAQEPFGDTQRGLPTFTDDKMIAGVYGDVHAYRLNIKNPIHLNQGREDVTEANVIFPELGYTDEEQAWKAFKVVYESMGRKDYGSHARNSWRPDGDNYFEDAQWPLTIEGYEGRPDDPNFQTRTYKDLREVFHYHWNNDWPGLYCHSFDLADNPAFQDMVRQSGKYDGILMFGHTNEPSGYSDDDQMTGTSWDGITALEWRALDPKQIEYLGPLNVQESAVNELSITDFGDQNDQIMQGLMNQYQPSKPVAKLSDNVTLHAKKTGPTTFNFWFVMNETPVGVAVVSMTKDPQLGKVITVENIWVSPDARGQGIREDFYMFWLDNNNSIASNLSQSESTKRFFAKLAATYKTYAMVMDEVAWEIKDMDTFEKAYNSDEYDLYILVTPSER